MCAEKNIQLHGGIGFTWEHDAHIYLKRAITLAAVFGPAGAIDLDVARLIGSGRRRVRTRSSSRPRPRPTAPRCARSSSSTAPRRRPEQLGFFLDSGYALAHWPHRGAAPPARSSSS